MGLVINVSDIPDKIQWWLKFGFFGYIKMNKIFLVLEIFYFNVNRVKGAENKSFWYQKDFIRGKKV